jgi:glycyl-tRNA synthetase beta chain
LENGLRVNLFHALQRAAAGYDTLLAARGGARGATHELMDFFADRLKAHLRERGVRHDMISAVFALGNQSDLLQLRARAEALQPFVDSEDGRNLLAAYRRATNIVAIEEKRDGRPYTGRPSPEALAEPAERELHDALDRAQARTEAALADEDFTGAMAALAELRRPVDAFFEGVLVNSPEPGLRMNRLLTLAQIRAALERVADFSLVEDTSRPAA